MQHLSLEHLCVRIIYFRFEVLKNIALEMNAVLQKLTLEFVEVNWTSAIRMCYSLEVNHVSQIPAPY